MGCWTGATQNGSGLLGMDESRDSYLQRWLYHLIGWFAPIAHTFLACEVGIMVPRGDSGGLAHSKCSVNSGCERWIIPLPPRAPMPGVT